MKSTLYMIAVVITVIAAGCKQKESPQNPAVPKEDQPSATAGTPVSFLENWNAAHNSPDSAAFMQLYNDTVLYYGQKKTAAAVTAVKLKLLRPGYTQLITGPGFDVLPDTITCTFTKTFTVNGGRQQIPASLKLVRRETGWKIIAESDSATDARIALFKNMQVPENAVEGDYDGDGVKEAVWLVPPKIKEEEMECDGPCTARIRFSSAVVNAFTVDNCIGGNPHNLGDLNGDGADEIGVLHEWFTSCWKGYDVFTYKDGKWRTLVPTISTHCNQWEAGVIPAEKDPKRPGYVLIHYSEMTEDDLATKTKSVKVL